MCSMYSCFKGKGTSNVINSKLSLSAIEFSDIQII